MKKYPHIVLLLYCLVYSHTGQTTQNPNSSQKFPIILQNFNNQFQKENLIETKKKDEIFKENINKALLQIKLDKELLKEENEYKIFIYKHRLKTFNWQYTSSMIIFWGVILIVLIGLFFSGIQFYISLKQSQNHTLGNNQTTEIQESVTTFEASLTGVKVSSSILGVIILVISLAFFYLYLVYVSTSELTRIHLTNI